MRLQELSVASATVGRGTPFSNDSAYSVPTTTLDLLESPRCPIRLFHIIYILG